MALIIEAVQWYFHCLCRSVHKRRWCLHQKVLKSWGNTSYISGLPQWTKSFFRQAIKQPKNKWFSVCPKWGSGPGTAIHLTSFLTQSEQVCYLISAPATVVPDFVLKWGGGGKWVCQRSQKVSVRPTCPLESVSWNGLYSFQDNLWKLFVEFGHRRRPASHRKLSWHPKGRCPKGCGDICTPRWSNSRLIGRLPWGLPGRAKADVALYS